MNICCIVFIKTNIILPLYQNIRRFCRLLYFDKEGVIWKLSCCSLCQCFAKETIVVMQTCSKVFIVLNQTNSCVAHNSFQVEVIHDCSILAAVGLRMASTPGVSAILFDALAKVLTVLGW